MTLFKRFVGISGGAEALGHFLGKQFSQGGGFVGFGPGHLRAGSMVDEIVESEAKTVGGNFFVEVHDVAEKIQLRWLAVGAEAHDFVFVAKFQEAEILRYGAVEKSEGMGEGDGTLNIHVAAFANAPHSAGEITETVGGE